MKQRKKHRMWIPWMMILPAIMIRCLTTLYPVIMTFVNSFRNMDVIKGGQGEFIGLQNYLKLFSDDKIGTSMEFTIMFTVISMIFHLLLGVALAMMLNMKFKGKKFLRTIVLIPWAMPMIVAGRAARWGFNGTYGFVNDLIARVINGFHFDWLVNADTARIAVIIVDLWKDIPFFAILVLASLQYISADVYEAAKIDGAGVFRTFFSITVPNIAKTVMSISIFFTMWRVTNFELVYAMTSGGPHDSTSVLSYRILIEAFNNLNLGYASAIAVVLFIIMLILSGVNTLAMKKVSD
ncbi:carbohydrate ABC transporter permease [Blautia liquoris]